MSESSLKPLVFLHPLTPTLEKLREIMSENAEDEGIEVYDVESPEEGVQLVPVIGQSLIMCNSPKACAKLLQPVRKVIKKLETKTILISTKAIPGKTLEKFMKIGLTECVVEPVNPKTLLYKVRLQLRSIATKKEASDMALKESQKNKEKEESNNNIKQKKSNLTDSDDSALNKDNDANKEEIAENDKTDRATSLSADNEDLYARKKKERAVIEEDDELYTVKKKNKNNNESEDSLDYIDKNENLSEDDEGIIENRKSDHINGHYEGENNEDQNVDDKTKNKSNFKEDALGGHYQGDVSNNEEASKPEEAEPDEDIDTDALKDSIDKVAKSELANDNEKSRELQEIEEADNEQRRAKQEELAKKELRKSNFKEDALGGHYEGSVENENTEPTQKEKEEKDIKEALDDVKRDVQLNLTDESVDDLLNEEENSETEETEEKEKEKHNTPEDLTSNLEGRISNDEQENENKKRDQALELEKDEEELKKKNEKIDQEDEDNKHSNVSDQIDGSMNGAASTDELSDKPQSGEGTKADDIDGYLRGGAAKKDEDQSDEESDKSAESTLKEEDLPEEKVDREDEENEKPEKASDLDFMAEEESKESDHHDFDDDEDNRNVQSEIEFQDADLDKNKKDDDNDSKDAKRTDAQSDKLDKDWGGSSSTDITEDKNNKSNAKSDVISTHYSNKTSTSHNEDDYGKDWKANKQEEKSKEHKKREKVVPVQEVTPDGETIDYAKIKEQFDAFEYGSEQKKKVPYSFESEVATLDTIETTEKTVLGSDGKLVTMAFEDVSLSSDEPSVEYDNVLIFEPKPQGIQHVINILKLYQNPNASFDSVLERISKEASTEYQCDVVFYTLDKQSKKQTCYYNGFINNRITKPDESSFDHVDEFNESLSNFEQNLVIYKQDWSEVEDEHLEYWSMCKSPIWSDPTFQIDENIFVFPYFEGQVHLGFAVVKPELIIEEYQNSSIEILLESARGFYLNLLQNKKQEEVNIKETKKDKSKQGLFGSLFKKITG